MPLKQNLRLFNSKGNRVVTLCMSKENFKKNPKPKLYLFCF
jgi:hypothetical protein